RASCCAFSCSRSSWLSRIQLGTELVFLPRSTMDRKVNDESCHLRSREQQQRPAIHGHAALGTGAVRQGSELRDCCCVRRSCLGGQGLSTGVESAYGRCPPAEV